MKSKIIQSIIDAVVLFGIGLICDFFLAFWFGITVQKTWRFDDVQDDLLYICERKNKSDLSGS